MNEVQATAKLPVIAAGASVQAIVPQTFEDAYRIANAVTKSGMAPKDLDTAEKCLIAIMHGAEVGMTPMQSIQRIAIINGRATIWGDAAIGLVRRSGFLEYIKEWIEGEGDNMVAYCVVKRKGEPDPVKNEFSVADAKKARLWDKTGPWSTYPKRMLQMRPRGFCLRDVFADVLAGLYLREEIEGVQEKPQDITPPHSAKSQPKPPTPPAPPPANPFASPSVHDESEIEDAQYDEMPPAPPQERPQGKADFVDPDAFLRSLENEFASATDINTLNEIYENYQPQIEDMFPPDKADAKGMYEARKKQLEARS